MLFALFRVTFHDLMCAQNEQHMNTSPYTKFTNNNDFMVLNLTILLKFNTNYYKK